MKTKKLQRRFITLIEVMIVMILIALILGAVAYRFSGALDEGKAFKTKASMDKLETILNMAISDHPNELQNITNDWKEIVRASPIVKNPQDLYSDGWGKEYRVEVNNRGQIRVTSEGLNEYVRKNPGTKFRPAEEQE